MYLISKKEINVIFFQKRNKIAIYWEDEWRFW